MTDQQQPTHQIVGIGEGHSVRWRIARSSDMRYAGMMLEDHLDDGAIMRRANFREWSSAEGASIYMARLEDGSAGQDPDVPLIWLP